MPDPVALGRSCGTCTQCCKALEVAVLNKPAGVWCAHCKPGSGCAIYADRPRECGSFFCDYLTNPSLGEEWRPSRSKLVVTSELNHNRIAVYVDAQRPNAWRQEPYYSRLKQWAAAAVAHRGQVLACVGGRTTVVFPDREVDLGVVGEDELIVISERATPFGVELDASKIRKDDPRAGALPRYDGKQRP